MVEFGEKRRVIGLNSLTNGSANVEAVKKTGAMTWPGSGDSRGSNNHGKNDPQAAYAAMYGPTTGRRGAVGDTSLLAQWSSDYIMPGDECLHGGGKTLRDGLGLAPGI